LQLSVLTSPRWSSVLCVDSGFVHHVILSMQHFIPPVQFLCTLEASFRKASQFSDNPAEVLRAQLRCECASVFYFASDHCGIE